MISGKQAIKEAQNGNIKAIFTALVQFCRDEEALGSKYAFSRNRFVVSFVNASINTEGYRTELIEFVNGILPLVICMLESEKQEAAKRIEEQKTQEALSELDLAPVTEEADVDRRELRDLHNSIGSVTEKGQMEIARQFAKGGWSIGSQKNHVKPLILAAMRSGRIHSVFTSKELGINGRCIRSFCGDRGSAYWFAKRGWVVDYVSPKEIHVWRIED